MNQPTQRPIGAASLRFPCGLEMKNRFMLAPLTNCQSHADGSLSDGEFRWLTMRAKGGFGLTMTCAAHIHRKGQGFPGQLGIYDDALLEGHRRLAGAIREAHSLAVIQLHHAGMRSPKTLIDASPLCPSADAETGARAMTLDEVQGLRDDFISAAQRAQRAGYHGVEVHGAHGYILCQFLSEQYNRRQDLYGGSLENRMRLIFEILVGIREVCGSKFLVGIRLSPERFGMVLSQCLEFSQRLMHSSLIDFLDISLWDAFKRPHDAAAQSPTLLSYFAALPRNGVRLTVAGKIGTADAVKTILSQGVDFVSIGRAGILHHDFPNRVMANPTFAKTSLPVSRHYLRQEGLSEPFVDYMTRWKEFVAD